MNYKVMQRPMFKMGGKAASQGTGITSGLDEKVNYSIGGGVIQGQNMGAREGFKDPEYTYDSLLKRAIGKIEKRDAAMAGMNNLINMQALQQASNVLGQETSNNPLDILVNFAKQGTSIALPALSAKKKLELKQLDPSTDLALAKALKPSGGFGEKVYQMKLRNLGELENQEDKLRELLKDEKIDQSQFETEMGKIIIRKKIAVGGSFKTDEDYIDAAREYLIENQGAYTEEQVLKKAKEFKNLGSRILQADGGRVERQMGSPMMGEQPMAQAPQMMAPQQDVAMETQKDSGNKVYAMLRSRLPQEVPDEVVQLISYNKEAFADFASIKNQEDVTSFNEKYGVELVIDVATV
jgi:hypothetical protein